MDYFSGEVGSRPAGSLHVLPGCQNGESGEAGTRDEFGHCSLSNYDRHPAVGMTKGVVFKLFLVL